jgi:hypothetical protein
MQDHAVEICFQLTSSVTSLKLDHPKTQETVTDLFEHTQKNHRHEKNEASRTTDRPAYISPSNSCMGQEPSMDTGPLALYRTVSWPDWYCRRLRWLHQDCELVQSREHGTTYCHYTTRICTIRSWNMRDQLVCGPSSTNRGLYRVPFKWENLSVNKSLTAMYTSARLRLKCRKK